jgi:aryl-alcohol dehydrogenase-like predicted oxidoreductase
VRYRPFGGGGSVVSSVSLRLHPAPGLTESDVVSLIHGALEQGINYFEVPAGEPEILDALGEALRPVDRNLLVVSLRVGGAPGGPMSSGRDFGPQTLANQIVDAQRRTGIRQFDAAVLDDPAAEELTPKALETLKIARSTNRVRTLGVSGVDDAIEAYISTGAFDMLVIPFNLASGWRERRRLVEAQRRDMVIVGYDFWPEAFRQASARPVRTGLLDRLGGGRRNEPLAGAGTYAFLDSTPNWTSEQICMAYALSDVSVATIMVDTTSVEHLQALAEVADRELPSAVSAQVEMARFSVEKLEAAG